MRVLYTVLYLHLLPIILLRLYWRSLKAPAYRQRIHERLAIIPKRQTTSPLIWVHAVSVGETIAATPLIKQLQLRYPAFDICVTTTTPTGSDRVKAAFADSVLHYYLPYDLPSLFLRFIRTLKPDLLIVMETELWPNMLATCDEKKIPTMLANGRMSERSSRGYQRFSSLTRPMLQNLSMIAAQSSVDAQRFKELGAEENKVNNTGSIKFDIALDEAVITRTEQLKAVLQISQRRVAIFASTHPGEDELLMPVIKALHQLDTSFLAFIVPRHPERFAAVSQLCARDGLLVQNVGDQQQIAATTQVLIGNSMGDMLSFYGVADIAFIGGSLIPHGGHNFLEAAAWSLPILSGPAVFNFQTIADALSAAGGLQIEQDAQALQLSLQAWLTGDVRFSLLGENAHMLFKANQGALDNLLALIDEQLQGVMKGAGTA